MASSQIKNRLTITGPPGIGKTTVVKSVCKLLNEQNVPVLGFYTEEVRKNGLRIGFDVVSVDGTRAPLARSEDCSEKTSYKVGKYFVLLKEFESVALPILEKSTSSTVIVIDEIGKMELFSDSFLSKVKKLLQMQNLIMLMTIPVAKGKPIPLVEAIRNDKMAALFTVTNSNRGEMPSILLDMILKLQKL